MYSAWSWGPCMGGLGGRVSPPPPSGSFASPGG
jgi:hypothetical protein